MLHARAPSSRLHLLSSRPLTQNFNHVEFQLNHPQRRNLLTLAIETSCDDTAVAILEKDPSSRNDNNNNYNIPSSSPSTVKKPPRARLLFNEKITAPNTGLGGIHPIEALESHQSNLASLVKRALGYLPDASLPFSASSSSATTGTTSITPARAIDFGNGLHKRLPDFISVTRGPGMRSNLQCGLDTAKGLATAWQVPLLGVHHMQAHALTPRLVSALELEESTTATKTGNDVEGQAVQGRESKQQKDADPSFPFLTLLVSGGHTMLLHSEGLVDHKILATTVDIAIGDALDKAGRMILPPEIKKKAMDTAFAKHLSDFAFPDSESYRLWPVARRRMDEIKKPVNQYGWQMQASFADTRQMSFSFTSIPSSVEQILRKHRLDVSNEKGLEECRYLAITALGTAFEHLASRTIIVLETLQAAKQDVSTLVVSGGVASNAFLRSYLRGMLDLRGFDHIELLFPPPWLCTDNAAMIAWCGIEMYEAGYRSLLGVKARRKWSMDSGGPDGGILGVEGWERIDCV